MNLRQQPIILRRELSPPPAPVRRTRWQQAMRLLRAAIHLWRVAAVHPYTHRAKHARPSLRAARAAGQRAALGGIRPISPWAARRRLEGRGPGSLAGSLITRAREDSRRVV